VEYRTSLKVERLDDLEQIRAVQLPRIPLPQELPMRDGWVRKDRAAVLKALGYLDPASILQKIHHFIAVCLPCGQLNLSFDRRPGP
jgi:hypothetical protein